MESIQIKPDVLQLLCEKAELEGKSIIEITDEILRSLLTTEKAESLKCYNCKNEIDYSISIDKGYCDYCESVVFVDKN